MNVRRAVLVAACGLAIACGSKSGDPKGEGAASAGAESRADDDGPGVAAAGTSSSDGADDHGHAHDDVPFAECPVPDKQAREIDRLLDAAADRYEQRDFAASFACADRAADLAAQSVEAHHIRAAALAALGYHEAAQIAFTMALALDADDPETLAAAADFYINVMPKRRDATQVGLEFARRGRTNAVSRRSSNRDVRARLALLEGQAYNDLGRADEALERIDEALVFSPEFIEAVHERGVSLFNLCRFDDAREAFAAVLTDTPDDPYAHHHLGLIYERAGRVADAEAHFQRARERPDSEFWAPIILSEAEFRSEVDQAIGELDAELTAMLKGVSVDVSDLPAIEDLTAVHPPFAPTILGLFRGLPRGIDADEEASGAIPARAIVLYRKNLGRAVKTRAELDAQIRRTLLHEIGHLGGLDEDDLRRRGLD
jgi:tetratricopeptide (TPR) repeat protein